MVMDEHDCLLQMKTANTAHIASFPAHIASFPYPNEK